VTGMGISPSIPHQNT